MAAMPTLALSHLAEKLAAAGAPQPAVAIRELVAMVKASVGQEKEVEAQLVDAAEQVAEGGEHLFAELMSPDIPLETRLARIKELREAISQAPSERTDEAHVAEQDVLSENMFQFDGKSLPHVAVRLPVQQRITGPVKFLRKLSATWRLRDQDAAALLGFDETDADRARDLLAGQADLKGRDVKDRIVCLFQIRKTLHSLLQDDTAENEWLRQPHVELDQERPMDLLLEGSMENLLLVKDYVEAIAGS